MATLKNFFRFILGQSSRSVQGHDQIVHVSVAESHLGYGTLAMDRVRLDEVDVLLNLYVDLLHNTFS